MKRNQTTEFKEFERIQRSITPKRSLSMPSRNLVPAADPVALGRSYAKTVNAVSELITLMCGDLSDSSNADLVRLVEGGGRIGLEVTVDRHSTDRISLIAIEPEGTRYVFLTVTPPAPTTAQH
jgi:hypothetical protein